MSSPETLGGGPPPVPVCYRHPGRETYVRCSRCERPICPDCMTAAAVGHQCPNCIAEGRRTQRQPRTHFGGSLAGARGTVTKILIGLNVAVFLISLVYGAGLGGGISVLHADGAVYGPSLVESGGQLFRLNWPGLDDGGFHRLVTAMFLHYGMLHLLLNMVALWFLGRPLEAVLGRLRFLGLYFVSGIGGSVAAYLFAPNSFTAGASGAIYGLIVAFFIVLRKLGRDTSGIMVIIAINVIFTVMNYNTISVAGHFGGAVAGAICALGLAYAPRENRDRVQALVLGGTFLALVAITVALSLAR